MPGWGNFGSVLAGASSAAGSRAWDLGGRIFSCAAFGSDYLYFWLIVGLAVVFSLGVLTGCACAGCGLLVFDGSGFASRGRHRGSRGVHRRTEVESRGRRPRSLRA